MSPTLTRTEIANYTPEQVVECVRGALEIVDELKPDADLRAAVFTEASRLLSSKQVVLEQPQPMMLGQLPGLRQ